MKFPLFFEHSKVPVVLSKFAPIEIGAITLGPFVFCRDEISVITRNHESIHWEQYKECLFVGHWILYGFSYLVNIARGMSGEEAYRNIWFEKEAYANQDNLGYLSSRKLYAWARKS